MITVREYLEVRFSRANALTRKEALLIGLPWPLEKGWVKKHASVQIDDGAAHQLKAIADAQKARYNADRMERKERNRLNKMVRSGAMTINDANEALKASLPAQQPKQQPSQTKDGFYESREWRELRYKALVMHGAQCQCCGATRGDGAKLHVDHIKPRSKFPELRLDLSNLQILCEDCNLGKSNKDQTDWR